MVEKLSAAANIDLSLDADSLQRQSLALLNDVGGALLRRRSTPLAKQLFRATSSSLQFIDRQIAYLASQGYGLGAVAAMFASSAVDHMTENVGVRLGTLIGRLGIGGKAFVFEACRAVGEQQDSVVVLGMTTFYQGFITGYGAGVALLPADSADLVQAPAPESADQAAGAEPPEASALLRKLVLASYGADDQDVANTIGGGGSASSGALRDARERLLADSSDLPVETTDIYADWLAVNACYRGLGWHPRTTACDRERTRDAVAAILVEGVPLPTIDPRPKVVEGGGGGTERIETSTSSASELRVFESMLIERSRDRILLWPGGAAGGAGGAGDGVTKVDASAFADVASDLARKMADQHALVMDQHSDLLCEMRQKERHWRTTQFVAALCGIAKDEKIATCSDRKEIDAVATLSLNKQLMPDGEWAVYAGDNGKGFPRFGTCDTCCESTKPDLDNKPYCDRLRSDRGTSLKRLSRFGVRYTNLVRYEDDIASLAYNIEAIERQFNADNSHTITVSGRASSSAYLCKLDLLPRLMTGGNTAPPKCGGKPGTQRPSEGELCWEELDQKLYLRSSIKDDDIWCSTKGQDSWGKSMSDDYSKCVGGLDSKKCKGIKGAVFANDEERRERDANTMLSVLRGWRAAKVLRDKLPPSWSRRVHFEAHPQAPARCTSNTEDCFKYQTVGIRILPDLAATTYSCSNRSVTPP